GEFSFILSREYQSGGYENVTARNGRRLVRAPARSVANDSEGVGETRVGQLRDKQPANAIHVILDRGAVNGGRPLAHVFSQGCAERLLLFEAVEVHPAPDRLFLRSQDGCGQYQRR